MYLLKVLIKYDTIKSWANEHDIKYVFTNYYQNNHVKNFIILSIFGE